MSYVGKNIRKIRSLKGYSQAVFAELFGITRASIGAYEEGRAEPKVDLVIQIAKHFSLTVEAMLTKELTVNELSRFNMAKTGVLKKAPLDVVAQEVAGTLHLVRDADMKEYSKRYRDKQFIAALPVLQYPAELLPGSRAFEYSSNEMSVAGTGIAQGDWLIGEPIVKANWLSLDWGHPYLFIYANQSIQCRRVAQKGKSIELHADNPQYPPLKLDANNIKEVWKVVGRITRNLEAPVNIADRLDKLELAIEALRGE